MAKIQLGMPTSGHVFNVCISLLRNAFFVYGVMGTEICICAWHTRKCIPHTNVLM